MEPCIARSNHVAGDRHLRDTDTGSSSKPLETVVAYVRVDRAGRPQLLGRPTNRATRRVVATSNRKGRLVRAV